MKRFLFFFIFFPSSVFATVISSTTVKAVKNPQLGNEIQYITVIDTNSVQAGNNITIVATSSGISIAATGGGGGGYAVEPATVTFKLNQGFSATTGTFTTLSPGVMHIVAGSSAATTGLVSLSTETTGTLPDANLSSNVDLLNSTQTFSGGKTFSSSTTFTSTIAATGVSYMALGQTVLIDTNTLFQVGTSTTMAWNNNTGHLEFHASTTPTLSSCGTGPSIAANSSDMTGTFTMGSLTVGCTLTFSNVWKNIPQCFGNDETGVNAVKFVPTRSNVVITTAGSGGDTVDYLCIGEQ